MNTVELIKTIAARPGMYVDVASPAGIYAFIQGFYFSRSVNGGLDAQDRWFAESFYPWLKQRHGLEEAATWGEQIARLAAARRASPWDVFIGEFERFLFDCRPPPVSG